MSNKTLSFVATNMEFHTQNVPSLQNVDRNFKFRWQRNVNLHFKCWMKFKCGRYLKYCMLFKRCLNANENFKSSHSLNQSPAHCPLIARSLPDHCPLIARSSPAHHPIRVLTLRNGYQPLRAFYHSTWLRQHQIHLKYIPNGVMGCCQGRPIAQSKPTSGGMSG